MSDLRRFSGQESVVAVGSGIGPGASGVGGVGGGRGEETQVLELVNGEDLLKELEGNGASCYHNIIVPYSCCRTIKDVVQ